MIKKWDDRFRRPGDARTAVDPDPRPDEYASNLMKGTDGTSDRIIELGLAWIRRWWTVAQIQAVSERKHQR
jgi:hypothetical protein